MIEFFKLLTKKLSKILSYIIYIIFIIGIISIFTKTEKYNEIKKKNRIWIVKKKISNTTILDNHSEIDEVIIEIDNIIAVYDKYFSISKRK